MNRILFVLFGYLIGSLNFGLIVPEIKHKKDIRKYGSGNAGATNAYRLFGFVTGLTVLFLDSGKAVIYLLLIKKLAIFIFHLLL